MRKYFLALRGLSNVYFLKGEIKRARQLVDKELAIALEQDDPALLLDGYRSVGMCSFFVGEFAAARDNVQRANAIYDRSAHQASRFVYSTDPAVIGHSVGGWINWFLGNFDEARRDVRTAIELAKELQHPFSQAYARSLAASVHQVLRNPKAVSEHAEAAIAIAEEHGFPYWLGWSTVMRGWALSALGQHHEGIDVLKHGLDLYEGTGAQQIRPYILTLLAEMCGWAGLPQEGIAALEGAYGSGNRSDVCFYEAEALRIQGELMRQTNSGNGRDYFERALLTARRQGTRALELRAAMSSARASLGTGHEQSTRILLADIHRSFATGLDNPDLRDARDLLDALRGS